ncbi:hypothetical protein CAEBREN_04325 [Caenorhabditis brenneri]|uniref:Uncharacterized protein n=1 Tax=Caenorhabditis brenneri TaxID=135651 RepID=G0N8P9_CAEBE|nr:hypothetical protein CAEBREN_04325 [Caenorhabditis brenneri]
MSRFIQILPFALLSLCLAEDSGLYVNRIKIETFHDNKGNDKSFTYYVADSFDQTQVDNYKTEAGSIGSVYEDDYSADSVSCTVTECPKLRRIYAFMNTTGGITTTRVLDAALKSSTGATAAKPIGFVAPYPGYCSSDDKMPIIEMYSAALKQFAYWSPAQPDQLVNLASTTVDKSRYAPQRLVGYALSAQPERLVLENAAPDYNKPFGKANYTHSFFATNQLVQFTSTDNILNIAQPTKVDEQNTAGYTVKNTGIYLLEKGPTALNLKLEAVCGSRIAIYSAFDKDSKYITLIPKGVATPNIAHSLAGYTFTFNRPVCGGIKGLAALKEFSRTDKPGYFTYENDPAKIQSLENQGWAATSKVLGFAPLDQIGFVLINGVM